MRVLAATMLFVGQLSIAELVIAQSTVPVVELPSASVSTRAAFGAILGIRQLSNNSVLINDAKRRQVSLCDASLGNCKIVIDSIPSTPNSYPETQSPLIRYLGDSSLLVDVASKSFLLVGANGSIVRPMALPNDPIAAQSLTSAGSATDPLGRLVYKHTPPLALQIMRDRSNPTPQIKLDQTGEWVEVMRADLDERRVDTLGRVRENPDSMIVVTLPDGRRAFKQVINPLPTFDEWAMLSNGSVAIIRGHDYHIDWIHADGSKSSMAKFPFDWKSLSQEDKQRLSDSTLTFRNDRNAETAKREKEAASRTGEVQTARTGRGGGPGGGPGQFENSAIPEIVPLKDIADYYPPIRREAAMADLDDNLWILPTTSAQSRNGELVYDVVNEKSGLYKRVRLPRGRALAGFGKGGVVYLAYGTMTNGFVVERTQLPRWQNF